MKRLAIALVVPVLALGVTAAPAEAARDKGPNKETSWGCPSC